MAAQALDTREVARLGLDPEVIAEHQAKIASQLATGQGVLFGVRASGSVQDGVVLRLDAQAWQGELVEAGREGLARGELCTFVPAAGAASRYLKVFAALHAARQSGATAQVARALAELRELGDVSELPFDVPVPEDASDRELLRWADEVWARYGDLPKGLTPATLEGLTFFELKLLEHQVLNPDGWLAVVVAEGMEPRFAEALERARVPARLRERVAFLVQGKPLSTLRFDARAEPVRTESGGYSPVVAGHGELLRLFPQVAALGAHRSIFTINVDNVIGTSAEVQAAFRRLFGFYRRVLGLLDALREAAARRSVPAALAGELRQLAAALGRPLEAREGLELLLELQRELFHSDLGEPAADEAELWARAERLCRRPLTVQGLVPNTGEDVGGIPVFIDLDGRRVKICLEMAHASEQDQTDYFRNPERATHFNPVFVLHELCPQVPASERTDPRFWMLTKKPFGGREVYYHETVLYEAVGNGLTNNLLFVEIPRLLFHPHKVYTDTRGRTAASYGFEL